VTSAEASAEWEENAQAFELFAKQYLRLAFEADTVLEFVSWVGRAQQFREHARTCRGQALDPDAPMALYQWEAMHRALAGARRAEAAAMAEWFEQ
jgi:hypothetical protein